MEVEEKVVKNNCDVDTGQILTHSRRKPVTLEVEEKVVKNYCDVDPSKILTHSRRNLRALNARLDNLRVEEPSKDLGCQWRSFRAPG